MTEPMKADHVLDEDYESLEYIGMTHRLVAMPCEGDTFAAVIQVTSPADAACVTPEQAIELGRWLLRRAGQFQTSWEYAVRCTLDSGAVHTADARTGVLDALASAARLREVWAAGGATRSQLESVHVVRRLVTTYDKAFGEWEETDE